MSLLGASRPSGLQVWYVRVFRQKSGYQNPTGSLKHAFGEKKNGSLRIPPDTTGYLRIPPNPCGSLRIPTDPSGSLKTRVWGKKSGSRIPKSLRIPKTRVCQNKSRIPNPYPNPSKSQTATLRISTCNSNCDLYIDLRCFEIPPNP